MTESQVTILNEELSCNHLNREGVRLYELDSDKFLSGDIYEINATTRKWLVLTNFHGTMPLNMQDHYVQGYRTIGWANPLEYSRYLFSNLSDSHNYSALLQDWGVRLGVDSKVHHHYRDRITFILIPSHKTLDLKIGFAAPQAGVDERAGGGVQIRFKNLPKDTILLETQLVFKKSKSLDRAKEFKEFNFEETYNNAMESLENFLDTPEAIDIAIPQNVFIPQHKVFSAVEEFFDEEADFNQIKNYSDFIKKFDIRKYVEDKFQINDIREIDNK